MAKKKDSFVAYYDWEDVFADFTNEQFGELFRAIYAYEKRGEAYAGTDPAIKIAMRLISGTLDRNQEKYKERCEKNRRNALKRWEGQDGTVQYNANASERMRMDAKNADPEPEPEHEPDREYDPDPEPEYEHDAAGGAISFFRKEFPGSDSNALDQSIREACEAVGEEMVMEAMRTAVQQNKRSWGYCKGILNNWQKQNWKPKRRNALVPNPNPQPSTLTREGWMHMLGTVKMAFGVESEEYRDYYEMGRRNGWADT